VRRIGFRGRLFLILFGFALVPSMVLTLAWSGATWWIVPMVSSNAAWDSTAASGARALTAARDGRISSTDSVALARHEQLLREGQLRSRQSGFFLRRVAVAFGVSALFAFLGIVVLASRVAGHLSRNLSRPLQELVGWTERIARAEALPDEPAAKGAPEFELLRGRMRRMSQELERGRRAAIEAERGAAMRETARQVAHELKNPLTPIRFAVDRLRREAPPNLQESIEVLRVESSRLEELARSFAQFGRLPEGPRAPVDVGELARYTARSSVPENVPVDVRVADDVPMVEGHHEALARALSNVMLNAVEACKDGGSISVDVRRVNGSGREAVALEVRDTGCGIPANRLARIWDPYVTYKAGGTGLGLAIARQTVLAHDGEVSAESEPGKGTVIKFILPLPLPGTPAPR
jgi:two-component system nitrogen regulation sensor histidine kinase NtrY